MTYRFGAREDGGWDVVPDPNSYWVAPERADDHTYRERFADGPQRLPSIA